MNGAGRGALYKDLPGRSIIARIAIAAACVLALFAIWATYAASVQPAIQPEVANAIRRMLTGVRTGLEQQDASVLRFATTRDAADLESYRAARQPFDAELAGLGAQLLSGSLPNAMPTFNDLKAAYHTWLTNVPEPLAHDRPAHQHAVALVRLDKALMDRMERDFSVLFNAAEAASALPETGRLREIALAAFVAALLVGLLGTLVIVAEQRREELEAERKRVFETLDELVGIADASGRFTYINSSWQRKLGYSMRDLAFRSFVDIVHPDDRGATAYEIYRLSRGEPIRGFRNRFRGKDGTYRWMMWNAIPDPALRRIYVSARDETEQVRVESELTELSYADPLTGLPNRRQFFQQLQRAINMARRHRLSFSVLYLDLDQLKKVNDTMSHAAGDEALKGMAANISAKLRESDLFARVGGDEFGILTPPIALPRDVNALAQKVIAAAAQPIGIGTSDLRVTVSLGVASFPEDGTTPNDLLAAADRAMYTAKRAGGDTFARAPEQAQESPPSA
jgi:diguanylate cyclase